MGQLIVTEFMTLDGVAQAPGAPDEDRDGGFTHGGWQAPLLNEDDSDDVFERAQNMDALVLGRKTESLRFPGWLVFMGDASYSIYLTHTIVLLLVRVGYDRLRILQSMPHDLHYLVAMLAIAAAGALSYLWVEKPLLTLCRKLQ